MCKAIVIGIDLGGTNIRVGGVTRSGKLVGETVNCPTGGDGAKDVVLGRILASVDDVINVNGWHTGDIMGIGVGATGPIDPISGLILDCPQLPGLNYVCIRAVIEERFQLPVVLSNDANALILAESLFGAAVDNEVVLGFTLGTGVGCAIIIGQHLYVGSRQLAGEVWKCPYRDRTIEDIVSGKGISRLYTHKTGQQVSALQVARLAASGDENARECWSEFGSALGFALGWCSALLDPDVIVLGGSIANAYPLFAGSMIQVFHESVCRGQHDDYIPIRCAQLGDQAGVIGAAALYYQSIQHV